MQAPIDGPAEKDALNNECVPNNEVLRISSYRSIVREKRVNASMNVREMLHKATQEAEHSLESVVHGHHAYKYINFILPALVSSFLFVPMWGMRTNRIILCCFGDRRCEMVGHIPRIICSAMISVFV